MKFLVEKYLAMPLHKGKRHFVKLFLFLYKGKFIKSHYGPLMRSMPDDITNVYAISGNYEHVISGHISGIENDGVFIDIGANYGLYSLLASRRLSAGSVFAFEPNPKIYPELTANLNANNADNVSSYNMAVGDFDGDALLSYDEAHSGTSRIVSDGGEESADYGGKQRIKMCNISKFAPLAEAINDQTPVHIKIDVEGFENNIVDYLRQAPWFDQVKSMVIEIDQKNLSKFGGSAASIYDALQSDGFATDMPLDLEKHYDAIFVRS